MNTSASKQVYDAVIVGGGISGLVFLKYAREQNLRCLALEKQADIGGLWRVLPSWQDIQNRVPDFAINGIPLAGASQPHIHRFVREWVQEYELQPCVKVNAPVRSVSREGDTWNVRTHQERYVARNLIIASGIQNRPIVPPIQRIDPEIVERHSSELFDPEELRERRVTVVGGGTSSWDLLELALEHRAKEIHWVHRSVKWSLPTGSTKQRAWPNIREMALMQSIIRSIDGMNSFLRRLADLKQKLLRLESIRPDHEFDQRKDQLVPARSLMCRNLDLIRRHRGEVDQIEGRWLRLSSGDRFSSDILLWATGYRMDLSYLRLPEYERLTRVDDLFPRLGYLLKSLDYPDMFFVGMPLLGSTSATPFFAAVESKTIVAHMLGRCRIPDEPILHQINHWDLLRYFARFDTYNYPALGAGFVFFFRALYYMLLSRRTIRV
jgi:cation diffusion facilitator CzcD-associated flavoprotein CzcO